MSQSSAFNRIAHGPQGAAETVLDASAGSESDSSSNEPAAKRRCGRKVENPIWDYYSKKGNPKKVSVCQVQNSNGLMCGHIINGWYATNAIHQLRTNYLENQIMIKVNKILFSSLFFK